MQNMQKKISNTLIFFPCKIFHLRNISKLNIGYISSKNIVFNHFNLELNEPHEIIISNNT